MTFRRPSLQLQSLRFLRPLRWLIAGACLPLLASACRERTPSVEAPSRAELTATPRSSAPTPNASASTTSTAAPVFQAPPDPALSRGDRTLFEGKSDYSHMRVVDSADRRHLLFVRDGGEAVVESSLRLDAPDELEVPYTRAMFVSWLFKPRQQRVVLVGLGGGSMVRFSNRFFPEVQFDVVEIDPLVVRLAREFFGVREGARAHIQIEDGFKFFETTGEHYDAIYIDAFVKPAGDTDQEGMPLRLKTRDYLTGLRRRLTDGGVVVINLNDQPHLSRDVEIIRDAFPDTYLFPVPKTGNLIAVGATHKYGDSELRENGRMIDRRGAHGFSFEHLADLRSSR